MPDPSFLTPEMFSMLVNNGLGGLSLILLFQVNARLGRLSSVANQHNQRIAALEKKCGLDTPPQPIEGI